MKRALITFGVSLIAATPAFAQRTSVSRDLQIYDNGGLPDLTVDPKRFVSQMEIVDRLFEAGDCELQEGTVGAPGYRRILRFDTVVMNMGDGNLEVGDPTDPNNPYAANFDFAECHGHHHNRGFSDYQLLTLDRSIEVRGHKQAFCLEDSLRYSNQNERVGYDCRFQGITSGYGDWYFKQLSGQWIDITGVPEGDYIVRVTVNAAGLFAEGENRHPNTVEAQVHVPNPRNKVTVDTSPLLYAK